MSANQQDYKSILGEDIDVYVRYKRALGRKFETEQKALRLLDRYLVDGQVGTRAEITAALVEDFLASRPRTRPRSYNHLLGVTRCFFEWLVGQERLAHCPVQVQPRRTTSQQRPFLFAPPQARRLLELARSLSDQPKGPDRGPTYYVIFSLMYALGLRVGEVSRLRCQDIDFKRQLLEIRGTKFAKDRLVPFGPKVGDLLSDHIARRERRCTALCPNDPVFSFHAAQPVHPGTISQTFHHLVTRHPFSIPPGVAPPRLHCLRHSFAVATLLRWYRSGVDPNRRLIHLSTFLGHATVESTAWYLTVTDELLDAASERFRRFAVPSAEEGTA